MQVIGRIKAARNHATDHAPRVLQKAKRGHAVIEKINLVLVVELFLELFQGLPVKQKKASKTKAQDIS